MVHFHPSPLKINGRRVELNLTRLWNIRILTPGFCAHWASAYSFIPLKSFKVRVLGENIKHVTSNGFKKPCPAWDGSRCGPDRIDGTYSRAMHKISAHTNESDIRNSAGDHPVWKKLDQQKRTSPHQKNRDQAPKSTAARKLCIRTSCERVNWPKSLVSKVLLG
jgi:hypothetical protein